MARRDEYSGITGSVVRKFITKAIVSAELGITSVVVEGTTITFTFADNTTAEMTFPTPADGEDGADGVSIVDVDIDANNHLICTLSDGNTVDAGALPMPSLSDYYTKSETDDKFNPTNNFKTINGQSIVGSGNIEIQGGGGGGTTVVANPTLAGTESNLEGIQIGSTKYKVGNTYEIEQTINKEEVYVGTSEPSVEAGYKVWINPTETPTTPSGGSGDGLTLLWTNTITPANKTENSVYPYTELNLDVSGYTHVVVDYIFFSPYNHIITHTHPVGQSSRVYYCAWNENDVKLPQTGAVVMDRIVVANKTGTVFKFYDGSVNGAQDNHVLIPWRIWGLNQNS